MCFQMFKVTYIAHLIFELDIAPLTLTTQSVGHGSAAEAFITWEPARNAESQAPPQPTGYESAF